MRIARRLLIATACLSGGCAAMIARSGKDLAHLETREEVHAKLGTPSACGVGECGPYEEFRTHWKIARPYDLKYFGPGYAMGLFLTCGAIDLILVPQELYLAARGTIRGQTIRATYDSEGALTQILMDGESLRHFLRPKGSKTSANPAEGEGPPPPPPGPP